MTPVVRVIGYSRFTGVPAELLPDGGSDLEGVKDRGQDSGSELARLVECAGRCCYDSYARGRSSGEYCEHILMVGHGSVLEHSTINFFVSGVSRGLTHELVRHRVGVAYSQRSTRYCDESESEWAWHPLVQQLMDDDVTSLVELQHLESLAKLYYGRLVDKIESRLTAKGTDKATARKQARGAARGILGNALSTEIVVTFNLRALRHFLKLRASEHADGEIRLLANEFYLKALEVCPEYFSDYERRPCPDGIGFALTPKYREV